MPPPRLHPSRVTSAPLLAPVGAESPTLLLAPAGAESPPRPCLQLPMCRVPSTKSAPTTILATQVSTRILGRRTRLFQLSLFLTASCMVLPNILVLTAYSGYAGLRIHASGTGSPRASLGSMEFQSGGWHAVPHTSIAAAFYSAGSVEQGYTPNQLHEDWVSFHCNARPAPSPSPAFVPGIPHILIELSQARISYQDYHVLLLTLAGHCT